MSKSNIAKISDAAGILKFIKGGRAIFTIVSKRTGKRFTYKVSAKDKDNPNFWFVSLLVGPNNTDDYEYLCTMREYHGKLSLRMSAKSCRKQTSPSFLGLQWLVSRLNQGESLGEQGEFWHEGRCCRCGRALTVPESIKTGIGPVCAGMA